MPVSKRSVHDRVLCSKHVLVDIKVVLVVDQRCHLASTDVGHETWVREAWEEALQGWVRRGRHEVGLRHR